MNVNTTDRVLGENQIANQLVSFLKENEEELGLVEAEVYYDFPILKVTDEEVVISEILIVSRRHGVIAISTSGCATSAACVEEFKKLDNSLESLFSLIFSRLIRNKSLRKTKTTELPFPVLSFPALLAIYAPHAGNDEYQTESELVVSNPRLQAWLSGNRIDPLDELLYQQLVSTIEGAKGLVKPKLRELPEEDRTSKGYLANLVESEIASFDVKQKHGSIPVVQGVQRIRGIAGSGKTVVLAMKAAILHLRNPDATILYTFYTKSLYQQIRRLITRFYRQFDDRDPDWSKILVMHAWGGFGSEGVLFNACVANSVTPLTFGEALKKNRANPFAYACEYLMANAPGMPPLYDHIFIDEGQDFPPPFFQLCLKLVRENRLVFAYDELQNIFQVTTPTMQEILGNEAGREIPEPDDVILYKCYRNPREILVCAHALGFALYSKHIVQMLENREQWEDVGYKVVQGDFVAGSPTVIERPRENSLTTLSDHQTPEEIVQSTYCENIDKEIALITESIQANLAEGLRPDDILIVVVDDRNSAAYTETLMERLSAVGIGCNNMNADRYGIRDFQQDGYVTVSTVHKAKGNEAYMVYVVGVDALFDSVARVQTRNRLFTAMTRAKGWVRVSGVGAGAEQCHLEIQAAMGRFPNLEFTYPSQQQLKVIKRDLAEKDLKRLKAERKLEEVMGQMSAEEIQRFMESRIPKKPSQP